jgi:Hemimethylated DNA-binding protein YccV like
MLTIRNFRRQHARRIFISTQVWLHKMAETSSNVEFSATDSKAPVGRALYRQALRWCKDNEKTKAPISHLIPVQIFSTPIIEKSSLQRLYSGEETGIKRILPLNSIVKEDGIFVSFETISEIRDFWRAAFRMNKHSRDEDVHRVRISAAFSSMKGLNELSKKVNEIEKSRESHCDREGVTFRIGQVVRHTKDNWRAIILGWEKGQITSEDERQTSLTSKQYLVDNFPEDGDGSGIIWYKIIPDFGDLSLSPAGTIRRYEKLMTGMDGSSGSHVALEKQTHLELVDDVALCRVRSKDTSLFFERFDNQAKRFIPNQTTLYEYPLDYSHDGEAHDNGGNPTARLGENVTKAVQTMARRLEVKLFESQKRMIGSHSALLDDFQVALSRLARGDVFTEFEILKTKRTPEQLATRHLNELCQFSTTISEFLALRRIAI